MPTTFTPAEALDVLERTPSVLGALLRDVAPGWYAADEGPGTWSPFEVVGHLVHAEETNWVPRARHVLERGEGRPFEPFDRSAHLARFEGWPLGALLDRFAGLRASSLQTVRSWSLSEEDLALRGSHPALGAVTLRELLATWAVHDLAHVGQVVRTMARRYADDVGPWREYLPVLPR